jgi:hypothetical protein
MRPLPHSENEDWSCQQRQGEGEAREDPVEAVTSPRIQFGKVTVTMPDGKHISNSRSTVVIVSASICIIMLDYPRPTCSLQPWDIS